MAQTALHKEGSDCYFTIVFQAISSCPRFAAAINEMSEKWKSPNKLNMFTCLINTMKSRESIPKMTGQDLFPQKIEPGQQDCYALLAYLINQVLNEIRTFLEDELIIKRENLREWLSLRLPLRITMEYHMICGCGKIEVSPMQSEIALHISFKDVYTDKKLSLVDMLESHFDTDEIHDYDCADARCTFKSGSRRLKLFSPLPETLCIHLQRLFWDGSRMKKIDKEVSFSNRITMKKDYSKVTSGEEQAEDCHYYLRSVIVHHGTESCGHYICHTKRNNRWYYTSDSSVRRERAVEVFRSNPYILFYERSEVEEVSPRTVKYSDCINLLVHAVAACPSFVTWLNAWVHVPSARSLRDLLDLSNGNIGDDEVSEGRMIKEWIDIRDIRELIIIVLPTIHSDVSKYGGTPMEVIGDANCLKQSVPTTVDIAWESKCGCGRILDQSTSTELVIDIKYLHKYAGGWCIQDILGDHFKGHRLDRSSCQGPQCNGSDCIYKITLKGPLPEVICMKVAKCDTSGRYVECHNSGINIDNQITIRRGYVVEADEDKTYYLRSVIYNNYCLRNVSGSWYRIDRHDVGIVNDRESWKKGPCILFYEAIPVEERPNSPEYTPEDVDPMEYDLNVRSSLHEVPIRMIEKAHCLNMFIHTIDSCPRFLNWLKDVNIGGGVQAAKDLTDLIDLVNGRVESDAHLHRLITSNTSSDYVYTTMMDGLCKLNADVLGWSQSEPPKVSYGGVDYSIPSPMVMLVRRIVSCDCGHVDVYPPSMEIIYDISFRVSDEHRIVTIQEVFDKHFEVKYVNGSCSSRRCAGTRQSIEVKLGPYLPEILCVKLTLRYGEGHTEECCDKRVKMDDNIVIRSIFQRTSDSSDKEYSLKAFVDKDHCHRCVGGVWYRIGRQSIEVDRDEHLMEGDVAIVIYEACRHPSVEVILSPPLIQPRKSNVLDMNTLIPVRVNDKTFYNEVIHLPPPVQHSKITDQTSSEKKFSSPPPLLPKKGSNSDKGALTSKRVDDKTSSKKTISSPPPLLPKKGSNSDKGALTSKRVDNQTLSEKFISSLPPSEPRERNISNTDTLTPKMVNEHKRLNSIVHALSSCSLFLDKLHRDSDVSSSSLGRLCYLTDLANGYIGRDKAKDKFIASTLRFETNDVQDLMVSLLRNVDRRKCSDLNIIGINFELKSPATHRSDIFVDVRCSPSMPATAKLQMLLEEHLELIFDSSQNKNVFFLKYNDIPKNIDLPDTLCFRLPRVISSDIDVVEEVIFGNKSCPRLAGVEGHQSGSSICEKCLISGVCFVKYYLRAFIDKDDVCYRSVNGKWMRIDGNNVSVVDDCIFKEVRPQMIFYEIDSNK